jgi:pyrimidine operon attenuation protein/uracil phosphoribosyltransferase
MEILDNKQIIAKIERLAYQIYENNYKNKSIILLGINNNGYRFAELLKDKYDTITEQSINIGHIRINAANPLESEIELDIDLKTLNKKTVIIVDDVANTGRTIFYGTKPIMEFLPKKIEAAVLVDRKHKLFPIKVDYVGLTLATTLKENITVDLTKKNKGSVSLN